MVVIQKRKGLIAHKKTTNRGSGGMDLNEQLNMNLNGVPQFVSIRAEKAEAHFWFICMAVPGMRLCLWSRNIINNWSSILRL